MKPAISISRGEIRNEWRGLLNDLKLESCRKICRDDIGEPFKTKSTSGSEVYRFEHPDGSAVYVKRYDGLSVAQALKRLLKLRWPRTNAFYEYRMAEILRELGFKVMEPMAWAEDCAVGVVPLRGGVVVGEVQGRPLDQVFLESAPAVRPQLLRQIGRFWARLHIAGHPQTPRLSDLICTDIDAAKVGKLELAIIDLDLKGRPARLVKRQPADLVKALARATYSFLRARHRVDSGFEVRMFFSGYNEALRQQGLSLPKGFLRAIIDQVDSQLDAHAKDARLSLLVPNMPKSLNEITRRLDGSSDSAI